MLAALGLQAQTFPETAPKPPKIRYTAGFFATRYEIGDKDATERDIVLHFEKHNSEAYHKFQQGKNLDGWALGFSVIGLGFGIASLVEVLKDEPNGGVVAVYGLGTALCIGTSLVIDVSAKSKKQTAIDHYNRQFGY